MSQENLDFVRAVYASLNRGDERVWESIPEGFILDSSRRLIDTGVVRGRDKVRADWESLREAFDETFRLEPEELIDADDKVVAFIRVSGTGRASRARVETSVAHVWAFHGGRAAAVEYFGDDRAGALEAAGLSE